MYSKIRQVKIIKHITKEGLSFLLKEKSDLRHLDQYLVTLVDFLFEYRSSWNSVLSLLKQKDQSGMGGNSIYFKAKGPTVIIYDYYFDEGIPENGIFINRENLTEIIEAWKQADSSGNINEIVLQRDRQHITLIVKFDDQTEFRKSFNYRWQDEPYAKTGDHYIDTLREFLFEHRWRAEDVASSLKKETSDDFGVNKMYMKYDGPEVTIYNYFDEKPTDNAITIKKDLLIKLFETIGENQSDDREDIRLERNDNQITITVHHEDGVPDLIKTFEM